MMDISSIGKTIVLFGIVIVATGVFLMLGAKFSWFGRLPGDICIQKKGFAFYFPITTSILVSVIISVVFALLRRR